MSYRHDTTRPIARATTLTLSCNAIAPGASIKFCGQTDDSVCCMAATTAAVGDAIVIKKI